jgi:hypothetical protein
MRLGLNMSITGAGSVSPLAIYAVLGFTPLLVFDFDSELYATGGTVSTFDDSITHSAATRATMVDSDGVLKWRPHNLALNSASPATQSITVISGADYTVECTGVSIALSGAGSGTVTEGNPVEITASTTTLTLTVTGSTGTMWVYRSDLGGMVNNPDTGNSYVPTTSTERYLPRRGHHVWNGSTWVNEGLLHESEQRVNLQTYSSSLATSSPTLVAATPGAGGTPSSGTGSYYRLTSTSGNANHRVQFPLISVTSGATYTLSLEVSYTNTQFIGLTWFDGTAPDGFVFDILNGVKGSSASAFSGEIVSLGSGVYRISITGTANGSSIYPNVVFLKSDTVFNAANISNCDGTETYDFTFMQLEAGPTPSSYIPTSNAAVTREAETLTVPAAKLPYSATAMSIQMEGLETFADEGSATQETLFDWRVDSNNRITLALDTDSTKVGTLTLTMVNGSGTDETISTTAELTPGVNDRFNVAIVCTPTEIGIALDGTAETRVSHSIGLPDLSGADATLGGNGTRALVRAWNQDITDAGIEAASVTAPLLFGLPTISGNTNQGATLTASSAPAVIGAPTPTTTWQWLRDGAPISGATSSTYVLTGDDVGSKISVRQTVTNVVGTASATSAETATISAVPAGAIAQRDGAYILDRAGNYIEVRS